MRINNFKPGNTDIQATLSYAELKRITEDFDNLNIGGKLPIYVLKRRNKKKSKRSD